MCDEDRCRLLVGVAGGGFVERTEVLPMDTSGVLGAVALDLGGDGDRDLLLIRKGEDLLLECLSRDADPKPPVAAASSSPLEGVRRRLAWIRPLEDLPMLALWAGVWAAAIGLCRRGRPLPEGGRSPPTRLFLGHWPRAAGAAVAALCVWVWVLERPLGWRIGLAVFLAVVAALVAAIEIAVDRRRRAWTVGGYRLEAIIGRGGMGTVYRARHPSASTRYALKLLHPGTLESDLGLAQFRDEVNIGIGLDSPRLVRVVESGVHTVERGGRPVPTAFLVMELLDGLTLRELLDQRRLEIGEACAVVREVAQALQVLHEAGVVHRDIKPGNVMVLPGGGVKVMDLGAARRVSPGTRTVASVLGTYGYAAPEQLLGKASDPLSDIYAAGVVLYESIAGAPPFPVDELADLSPSVRSGKALPLRLRCPEVDAEIEAIAERAMAAEPRARFQSAAELARALEPFAERAPGVEANVAGDRGAELLWAGTISTDEGRIAGALRVFWTYLRYRRAGGSADLAGFAAALLEGRVSAVRTCARWRCRARPSPCRQERESGSGALGRADASWRPPERPWTSCSRRSGCGWRMGRVGSPLSSLAPAGRRRPGSTGRHRRWRSRRGSCGPPTAGGGWSRCR